MNQTQYDARTGAKMNSDAESPFLRGVVNALPWSLLLWLALGMFTYAAWGFVIWFAGKW